MKLTDAIPFRAGAIPAVDASVARAAAGLARRFVLACPHLDADHGAHICAEHPGAGVMCWRCFHGHAKRHSRQLEMTCDGCGNEVDAISPVAAGILVAGLTLHRTRGQAFTYAGSITVVAIGLCRPCRLPVDRRP